ncbi:mitochondrial Rho GTPase [Rhodotorula diobovata]|uniref:Mitochondrial Rho GTPase 1 n=1 Tax=Rhodotorula diobovata TaxID=5288 RepID=A0A5C5FQ35_9BASI|nr:mitochondrial Rho GTPase [Rhodotorula diobovata]
MRDVRVVLVGDEGAGKSSIISALIKEAFVRLAPRTVLPEVTIPPSVTPGHDVTTVIVDTSPRPEDRSHLVNEIRKAHVVGIVYAVDNPNSFDRVPTYWLPTIRALGVNVPVVLIGNKIDLREGQVTNQALEDEIVPIMQEYKEVETCVECSAFLPLNISEVFFFAQNAVLHPTAPLYDTRQHVLKPACVSALSRIFRLVDADKDGLLSPDELNDFQRLVFDAPLQARELEGVKDVVEQMTDGSGVEGGGLNEEGWLALHTYFVQKGRLETTWKALRCFGYGEDLMLREEFLFPRFDIPSDCTAELSPRGYQFFTDIFESFDQDRDGALSPSELDNLFSTAPGNPWLAAGFPETTLTTAEGAVTLQGWLAQWSMTTLLEPRVTLSYLAYLGYPHSATSDSSLSHPSTPAASTSSRRNPFASTSAASATSSDSTGPSYQLLPTTSALQVTKPRRPSRRKLGTPVERSVFLAYVLGASGSGKTALLRAFVGKGYAGSAGAGGGGGGDEWAAQGRGGKAATWPKGAAVRVGEHSALDAGAGRGKGKSVVNCVEEGGGERYLVLQEFGSTYESEVLRNKKKLELADVLVFVYDSSDTNSFSYVSNLRQQYKLDDIPTLFVATKSDLDLAQQRHEVQPDTYCRKLSLRVPLAVSVKRGELADLYHTIVRIAQHPLSALPYGPNRSSASSLLGFPVTRTQLYVCASAGLTAGLAIGVVWWLRAAARVHAAVHGHGGAGTTGAGAGAGLGGGGVGAGLLAWLGFGRG